MIAEVNRWSDRTKALALLGLVLLLYGFASGRGFIFDDIVYISENPQLRRPDALRVFWFTSESFNYYPLFWSLLRGQWLLWGDHAIGYHLVNLLLHGANAVLLWRIALAWRLPGAWWIAALFAVHPINVQTIAWAAEQKNTWSFLFMACSALAFIKHAQSGGGRAYAVSLLCFFAALACKTSTVCLPVFLATVYGFRSRPTTRAIAVRLIPFFVVALGAGITTVWFEQHRVGGRSLIGALGLWQRAEAAGAAFWFYLQKALVPIHLTPFYPGWAETTAAAHTAMPGALLVLLLLLCAIGWRRLGAPIALGLIYYVLMLSPLLGIFDTNYFIYSLIADHWQYHALPGLLAALVGAVSLLPRCWPGSARYSGAAGGAGVISLGLLASAHLAHFEDAHTLWTYVVARNPDAWLGWYNLGNEEADAHKYPQAIAAYRRTLAVKPEHYRAAYNLSNSLAAVGRLEEADHAFLEAARLRPEDADVHVNHGVLLLRLQRNDEAVQEFERAVQLNPRQPSALINLMAIDLREGNIEAASSRLLPSIFDTEEHVRRVAAAIIAGAGRGNVSKEKLEQFATRALQLSGGAQDLATAVAKVQSLP